MYRNLYELLLNRAAAYPAAVALGSQEGGRWKTLDSLELLGTVDLLADDLVDRGVREGNRVVLWLPSSWRTAVIMYALWKLGAIVVPFDREMNPELAATIIASVEPRLVLTGYGERPAWAPLEGTTEWWQPETSRAPAPSGNLPSNHEDAKTRRHHADPTSCPRDFVESCLTGSGSWEPPKEELAALVFTSGTTGQPKGCMITHTNLCSQVEALRNSIPLDPSCRLASILPMSHLFGLTGDLLYALAMGAAIHFVPSRKGPDILRVFQEQRISHMIAVPQLLTLMVNALDNQMRSKLPSWLYGLLTALADRLPLGARRHLFGAVHEKLGGHLLMLASGGAALPVTTMRLWERIGVRVVQGYGASECSPVISIGSPDGSTPPGSVGKPIHDVDVKLSPEGELMVRGPNVMKGYWKDPERTASVLHDGWYCTGDLATIDQAGNMTLVGRARELIVLPSGMKVWPSDLEDVLRADPDVKDAVVIPVATSGGGARLHAYLIPGEDRSADPRAVIIRCNPRLAQHQQLSSASWWPEADFLRTSLMKVRRHLLPAPEEQRTQPSRPVPMDDPISRAIASIAQASSISSEQTLGDLGMDSMGLVQLALALEESTGKEIGDGDLRLDMTADQVRDVVAAACELAASRESSMVSGDGAAADGVHGEKTTRVGMWPYSWGRIFRFLSFPFDLLYALAITDTIVLGKENLADLPRKVIFAGTHHSFADVPLVRRSLAMTPARHFAGRLVIAAASEGFGAAGLFARYGILAFGLYPLRRFGAGKESLEELAAIAEAGNAVLVFAQGTHARPEQERAGDRSVAFKMGTAHLARELGAAVVPFGLAGTEVAMPAFLEEFHGPVIAGIPVSLKRVPLAIAYGKPMEIEAEESLQDFTHRLQEASHALTRQAEAILAKRTGKGVQP